MDSKLLKKNILFSIIDLPNFKVNKKSKPKVKYKKPIVIFFTNSNDFSNSVKNSNISIFVLIRRCHKFDN